VVPVDDLVALGSDGYICLAAGVDGFSIPLDNPLGYAVRVESSFTQDIGAGISGITVSQERAGSLRVHIPAGNSAGNEGTLHIKVMTAKEGRLLYEGDLGIAYLANFDTRLSGITLSDALSLSPAFSADQPNYSVSSAPASFTLTAAAANTAARITIDGETGGNTYSRILTPPDAASSQVLIRVELPHGAALRNYSVTVNRSGSGGRYLVVTPIKTVFPVQAAAHTGLDASAMSIVLVADGNSTPVDANDAGVAFDYDFSTPGSQLVSVTYDGLSDIFPVWVVGFASLSVTGPDNSPLPLRGQDFNPVSFSPTVFTYNLETVPIGISSLDITKSTGATSVETKTLGLGDNIIIISTELETVKIQYTLKIKREAEVFVSSSGDDDAGDGRAGNPYKTMKQALNIIHDYDLSSTDTVTITVSGNITGDTGTDNGMVDISGGGYPKFVLRGKGSGTDAGTIDAAGKNKRVLYISGGNKVTLGDNLTLTGGARTSGSGGGVCVEDSGSSFTMTGGTITGNKAKFGGMGVVVSGGSFAIRGGTISNNIATDNNTWGGGVYVHSSGSFTMTGGTISGNTAASGGGVYVAASSAAFTKTGGTIYGDTNTAHTAGDIENTATGGNGHAVYLSDSGKKRNSTADQGVKLYAKYSSGSGWTYIDPAVDGVGNTTGNWE
jgi:hypothetical protein